MGWIFPFFFPNTVFVLFLLQMTMMMKFEFLNNEIFTACIIWLFSSVLPGMCFEPWDDIEFETINYAHIGLRNFMNRLWVICQLYTSPNWWCITRKAIRKKKQSLCEVKFLTNRKICNPSIIFVCLDNPRWISWNELYWPIKAVYPETSK